MPTVDEVAADGEVMQHAGGPLAEPGSAHRVDAVAHRDDGVEIVVFDAARHLA